MRTLIAFALAVAACSPGGGMKKRNDSLPTCTSLATCGAHDGADVTVVGVYGLFPDQPGVDYTGVPRAVRITVDDGVGPYLEPYWHKQAVRAADEVDRFQGKRVRVTGRYYREQPRNPDDPPHASAVGGPCLHPVASIELAE